MIIDPKKLVRKKKKKIELRHLECSDSHPYPRFGTLPDAWQPWDQAYCRNMSDIWVNATTIIDGEEVLFETLKGCNYFVVGQPLAGKEYSGRFDPDSPAFQGWFGVYIVPPIFHRGKYHPFSPLYTTSLGNQDNIAWLDYMGYEIGTSVTRDRINTCVERSPTGVGKKWIITATQYMQMDVGYDNPAHLDPMYRVPREAWEGRVLSFQPAKFYTKITAEIIHNYLIFIYYQGVEVMDVEGRIINTWTEEFQKGLDAAVDTFQIDVDPSAHPSCHQVVFV